MNPTRKVDFGAYERKGYEAQYLYNGESCRVIASNVPPHAAAPPHHVHPVDQLYYVVEGRITTGMRATSTSSTSRCSRRPRLRQWP
jgi:mannose-6-phosphate isomerase-like protein (cupin superfamily)